MARHRVERAAILVALTALFLAPSAVSFAHHKPDHANGGNGQGNGSATTETISESSGDAPSSQGSSAPGSKKGGGASTGTSVSAGTSGSSDHGSGPGGAPECTNTHEGNFSGNGANTHGPYDSTCDGRPSENGNGGGGAGGRPCMGCVGNADNKNPKGQLPGGSDHNNGYECDGNNGVGKGNPAHTDCQPPPEPPRCIPSEENNFCLTPPPPPNPRVLGSVFARGSSEEALAFTGMDVGGLAGLGLLLALLGVTIVTASRKGERARIE